MATVMLSNLLCSKGYLCFVFEALAVLLTEVGFSISEVSIKVSVDTNKATNSDARLLYTMVK